MQKQFAFLFALIILFSTAFAEAGNADGNSKEYLVILQDGADQGDLQKYGNIIRRFGVMNAVGMELTADAVEELEKNLSVKRVIENKRFQIPKQESPPAASTQYAAATTAKGSGESFSENQWNLGEEGINAEAAWNNFNAQGEGIKIAIIDTGINTELPELSGRNLGSYCLNNECVDGSDNHGHGTMMATAMLADGNDFKGIAPKALYYNVRLTDDNGNFDLFDLTFAFEFAIAGEPIGLDVNIIYMGFTVPDDFIFIFNWPEFFANELTAGKLYVTPSLAEITPSYPTHYEPVTGVGGHDNNMPQALLPENGEDIDVVAPGKDVNVIDNSGNKTIKNGPDVAAAQVAGALALMIGYTQANALGYSDQTVREALKQSAIDLWQGDPKAGNGKADANAGLTWLANDWFLEYDVNYSKGIVGRDRWGRWLYSANPKHYTITISNKSNQTKNPKTIHDLNVVWQHTAAGALQKNLVITIAPGETKIIGPYPLDINSDTEVGGYHTQITLKKEMSIPIREQDPYIYPLIIKQDKNAGTFRITERLPKLQPLGFCIDSDNGVNPFAKGVCKDERGEFWDKSLLANGASHLDGKPVKEGAYVLEAFCLTQEMRKHCALFNEEEYCNNLPNECYAVPLLPSSALAWTYFERDDENFVCKKGSYNGTCKPCAAGWLCKDESHEAYLNEKCSLREIKECMEGCSNGRCNPCRPGPKCIDLFTLGVLDENCNWTEIIHCDPYGYCWADRCQSHPTLATPNPPASNAPQAAQRQPTEQQAISAEETGFAAVTTITQNMPAQPTQTETGSEAQTIVKTQPETIWQANEVQTALETGQPIARAAESAESPAGLAALVQNTANAIAAGIAAVFAWVAGLLFK